MFKNVDIADIPLEYVPELEDTYIYRPTETSIHEETFDGHDGGYMYGITRQPKEMVLRCIFEEKNINRGIMEKIHWLFRKGSSGKLVFKQRPWCYYYATVTEVDDKELFNYLNGSIKVTMKAYYPFARSDYLYFPQNRNNYFKVMESTGFFDKEEMMPTANIVGSTRITQRTSFMLYNPGTEYADVGIEIAGQGIKGVVIENLTTKQKCRFMAFKEEDTTERNAYIYYDGINGKCVMKTQTGTELNSLYHDYGFISLAPGFPVERRLVVASTTSNSARISYNLYAEDLGEDISFAQERYIGKYMYINNKWLKITDVTDEHTMILSGNPGASTMQKVTIATMNELVVYPDVTMNLSRLNFNYKPTFA